MPRKKGQVQTTIKCKMKTIAPNNDLRLIIKKKVSVISQLIVESSFLLNQYVLHCLKENEDVNVDTTLIRQCALMVLYDDVNVTRKKRKPKSPKDVNEA